MSRYDCVRYDAVALTKSTEAKDLVERLDHFIIMQMLDGAATEGEIRRYQTLARTALEECFMWIGKAIRDEQRYCRPDSDSSDVRERGEG